MFRKILAIIISILIFALVFLAVKFTKVEVPNFNRNLIMLAVVDISAFGLLIWKLVPPCENKQEEKQEEKPDDKIKTDKQKEESVYENQKESELKLDTKELEPEETEETEEQEEQEQKK